MYHYDFGWWLFPFAPLLWVAIWILVIGFVFRVIGRHRRWDRYYEMQSQKDMTAEEVLADRFARGKIDEKEYESRLEVLKKHAKKS